METLGSQGHMGSWGRPDMAEIWIPIKREPGLKIRQQVKALAANPDDLGSIPGTHTVGRKNRLLQVVL